MDRVTLHHGDCLDVLRTLPDASVHAVVCDPPYGLGNPDPAYVMKALERWFAGDREHVPDGKGFMGRAWDAFVPPPAVWDECLRVLKPGGHLLAFAGTRTYDLMGLSIRLAGFEIRDGIGAALMAWVHGQGFPKGKNQLKPAWEPIVMARKPLSGTVAATVLEHGTGAINVDACRVEGKWTTWRRKDGSIADGVGSSSPMPMDRGSDQTRQRPRSDEHPAGRWPANVVLTHGECGEVCSADCPVAELDRQSGTTASRSGGMAGTKSRGGLLNNTGEKRTDERGGFDDTGGASRFFPVFRYQAKAPASERPKVNGVAHSCVKPLSLMRWLVKLVTSPGGVVLDPFAGSGTTLEAAALEGFRAIGIEREESYIPLIQHRLDRVADDGGGEQMLLVG